jgi:phycoerythrobilin:ferredoxin oxidoreductase
MENIDIPSELASNQAPARGMKAGDWVTRIETRALTATGGRSPCGGVLSPEHPLSYARMALIETIPVNFDNSDGEGEGPWTGQDSNASNCVHSLGIQVLNIVIFPSPTSRLPVWGADFVSLPGDRHLLLLDAQPMDARARGGDVSPFDRHWDAWRKKSAIDAMFPWGGDLPDPVKPYVSSNALWTKMNITAMATENMILGPIEHITQSLPRVVESHLDIYLRLVSQFYVDSEMTDNSQRDYINYRLRNDPARPMLKSLYGEDWTDVVLKQVLFPPLHT